MQFPDRVERVRCADSIVHTFTQKVTSLKTMKCCKEAPENQVEEHGELWVTMVASNSNNSYTE